MKDLLTLTAINHEQAQAERMAGGLLTMVCHETAIAERQRLLSLAFWWAGFAGAFETMAEKLESSKGVKK